MDSQSSHYFDDEQHVESRRRQINVMLPDLTYSMQTDAGVFSNGRLDAGTKVLLLGAPNLPVTGTFLDLGCGAGPIALTMALRSPGSQVWAVDVNGRARELCADNAKAVGAANIHVASPENVDGSLRFDVIWSNPPIKVGKDELHRMMELWLPRLSDDGYAILVVHKNLGSDSLQKWLVAREWRVERIASRQGYRLLRVSH